MREHPDLLERVIDTAPLPLIEASIDSCWGGGAPFHSDLYDSGEFTGENGFGKWPLCTEIVKYSKGRTLKREWELKRHLKLETIVVVFYKYC